MSSWFIHTYIGLTIYFALVIFLQSLSWHDATKFCRKLSQKEGKTYRLPTEAEWEYACRAGTTTPFYFGQTISTEQANYSDTSVNANALYGNGSEGGYRAKTTAVGTFQPNAFGLYDMHGNVMEWCQDWYGHYGSSPCVDPQGPSSGRDRINRGGSWCNLPWNCTSGSRIEIEPSRRSDRLGFRVVLEQAVGKSKKKVNNSATNIPSTGNIEKTGLNKKETTKQPLAKALFDSQQAKRYQSLWAKYYDVSVNNTINLGNGLKMDFVLIPPGEFMMGSPSSEKNRDSDECPQHKVSISKGFYMGVYEVTQEQYMKVMGANPSSFKGDKKPVERVNWYYAEKFCKKLSQMDGRRCRLPTEAEWEYTCRAGTSTEYSSGNSLNALKQVGWCSYDGRLEGTKTVGIFQPNSFGLYDMHGNAVEWCSDWYDEKYYSRSPHTDPQGPDRGWQRVNRGGSSVDPPRISRSANRGRLSPDALYRHCLGFRVVMELEK